MHASPACAPLHTVFTTHQSLLPGHSDCVCSHHLFDRMTRPCMAMWQPAISRTFPCPCPLHAQPHGPVATSLCRFQRTHPTCTAHPAEHLRPSALASLKNKLPCCSPHRQPRRHCPVGFRIRPARLVWLQPHHRIFRNHRPLQPQRHWRRHAAGDQQGLLQRPLCCCEYHMRAKPKEVGWGASSAVTCMAMTSLPSLQRLPRIVGTSGSCAKPDGTKCLDLQ